MQVFKTFNWLVVLGMVTVNIAIQGKLEGEALSPNTHLSHLVKDSSLQSPSITNSWQLVAVGFYRQLEEAVDRLAVLPLGTETRWTGISVSFTFFRPGRNFKYGSQHGPG